ATTRSGERATSGVPPAAPGSSASADGTGALLRNGREARRWRPTLRVALRFAWWGRVLWIGVYGGIDVTGTAPAASAPAGVPLDETGTAAPDARRATRRFRTGEFLGL